MSEIRWYVVVLDDRREFALHVWRYLNRSLGIGIPPADSSGNSWMPERKVIPFLDGMHRFCWLHADGRWKEKLKPFSQELEAGWSLLVIVDVVGEDGSGYNHELVLSYLTEWDRSHPGKINARLVSAYDISSRIQGEVEVWPKSRSTLNEIGRRLYAERRGMLSKAPGASHILVTGAGFEIRNPRGGFGMLPTAMLMERMASPFQLLKDGEQVDENKKGTIYLSPGGEGFPQPAGDRWKLIKSIQKAAIKRELDRYWDILLGTELAHNLGEILAMESHEREEVTAKALLAERRMREAFRRSIYEHDWGHMEQSLAAARLPWHTWLSTNYTRFADRAIALMAPLDWRVISTAGEANISIREDDSRFTGHYRYLFRLHGDVGHLHSMAIAGHDKDMFSPLSGQIDDLYQVYASAERFLRSSLKDLKTPAVWHIVGHSLADRRLLNLVLDACGQVNVKHIFLIADPQPTTPWKNLEENLAGAGLKCEMRYRKFLAEGYMARLGHAGLPASADPDALVQWFEELPDEETLELEQRDEKAEEEFGASREV